MDVNFKGFGEKVATFIADTGLNQSNIPVKITAAGTVAKCTDGDKFCGMCLSVRDGYATVQLSGFVTANALGSIAPGYQTLSAGANNLIKTSQTGREYLVVESTSGTVGFIL